MEIEPVTYSHTPRVKWWSRRLVWYHCRWREADLLMIFLWRWREPIGFFLGFGNFSVLCAKMERFHKKSSEARIIWRVKISVLDMLIFKCLLESQVKMSSRWLDLWVCSSGECPELEKHVGSKQLTYSKNMNLDEITRGMWAGNICFWEYLITTGRKIKVIFIIHKPSFVEKLIFQHFKSFQSLLIFFPGK